MRLDGSIFVNQSHARAIISQGEMPGKAFRRTLILA
jgi:hypothetical protein